MPRYIDADLLKTDYFVPSSSTGTVSTQYVSLFQILNAPTADVVERKKMSNKEWVDFLSEQFAVSRTSAREMLHGLMKMKVEDNFKKQFSGGRCERR